jgi:hypothetical protein
MGAARQSRQHRTRLRIVGGFPEHQTIDHDRCVGRENRRVEAPLRDRLRLLARKALDVRGRRFSRKRPLIDLSGHHLERNAGGAQELRAPRRRRRQNQSQQGRCYTREMPRSGEFVSTRACASDTLPSLLARQPMSAGKIAFAWQLAVGPALARATTVKYGDGVLSVRSSDARWIREVERSRAIILERLQSLLGPAVSDLRTEHA